MADTKVSALPAATSALAASEIPINEAGTSKKLTVQQMRVGEYASGSFTIPTGNYALIHRELILTGSQDVTVEGTGALRIID